MDLTTHYMPLITPYLPTSVIMRICEFLHGQSLRGPAPTYYIWSNRNRKAKIAIELETDINLEFIGSGSSYEEVREGCEEFVSDYISFHSIEGVNKIELVYADNDGLILQNGEKLSQDVLVTPKTNS